MSYEIFENIDYDNLNCLHQLTVDGYSDISDIKINYSKNYNYLQENLNFLIDIGIFKVSNHKILIQEKNKNNFRENLIKRLFLSNSYFQQVKEYFQNFIEGSNGIISYEPDENFNFITSDLRNFLISLNLIKNEDSRYIITDFSNFEKFKNKMVSPLELEDILLKKKEFGLSAEKFIFEKEVKKLKEINESLKVKHISLEDVSAGYDIESYDEKQNKIFIEVKAISNSNFRFFLSSNEYSVSKRLGNRYFLYLIPKDLSNIKSFDSDRLLRINNIPKNIFENKSWVVKSDNFIIHKK